ncbi:porin family protein [Phocaeicola sp.]
MKKLAFFAVFALVALVASAQNPINWSVKAGVGISNITGSDIDGTEAKFGYKLGVGLECPFDPIWSLQTGLNFVSKGAGIDGADAKINALYLEVPIMAAARFAVSDAANVVVSAGPYLGYGVGGKQKVEAREGGTKVTIEEDTFGDDAFRRFDFGLGIGVAAEFDRIVVGLDGQFGLNKLHKDISAKNLSAFLTVGYKF